MNSDLPSSIPSSTPNPRWSNDSASGLMAVIELLASVVEMPKQSALPDAWGPMAVKSGGAMSEEILRPERTPTTNINRRHAAQRILVVDDNKTIRQLFFEVLNLSGYQVDTAEDGEMGWEALKAARYDPASHDLLITDNNMPKLSGVGLVRKLRSEHMNLPVIMATGKVPINIGDLHLAAILEKPLYPSQLVHTVRDVLSASRWGDTTATKMSQYPAHAPMIPLYDQTGKFRRIFPEGKPPLWTAGNDSNQLQ
ncbi:MAG: hypothetical protein JWR26_3021 [Pedosphaera sp.]|nr:hypothetical protein [Pedosphaera sp.]